MTDVDFSQAQREYYQSVQSIVDEITEAVRSGELAPEDAHERIWENVDGSQWVIYTYRAKLVACFLSGNGDAWQDSGCAMDYEGLMFYSQMAYYAMQADVDARLPDLEEVATEGWEDREMAREG